MIGNLIMEGIRKLIYMLSVFIYQLIIDLYEIFERLCNSRILDADILKSISERVGIVLGLVMLFLVVFSIIQMILEPEKLTDKEKGIGNIAKKIILVVVMLGTSSFIFKTLYKVQETIIDSHIISKILLPYDVDTQNFGGVLSAELFTTFFKCKNDDELCKTDIELLKEDIRNNNDFAIGDDLVNDKDGDEFKIDFNWLLCPLLGVGAIYFLFSYCLSVGIRTTQLAFLEIISPMAIISYLSPKKDTMFEKWWKLYFSTYIDVFLRIMVINLVVFLIATILDNNMSWIFWNSVGTNNDFSDTFISIFMIMALLMFAKKAPDLLKDLFPSSVSKLGLGAIAPKKIFDNMLGGNFVKGAAKVATAGTLTGGAGALISGISRYKVNKKLGKSTTSALGAALFGATTGFGRGLVAGGKKGGVYSNLTKAISKQNEIDNEYETLVEGGGTLAGKFSSKISSTFGKTPAQIVDRIIGNLNKLNDYYGEIEKYANDMSCVKAANAIAENATKNEFVETADQYDYRVNKRYEILKKAYGNAIRSGATSFEFEDKVYDISTDAGKDTVVSLLNQAEFDSKDTDIRRIQESDEDFAKRKTALQDRAKDMSFCIQEAVLTGNYNVVNDEDGNINYEIDFVDADGNRETLKIKDKDIAKAGMMKNVQTESSYYSTSHNVEKYDSSTDTMVQVGEITSASQFKKLKQETNETIAHVKNEKYFKHKAEDAAAKVKDSGKN